MILILSAEDDSHVPEVASRLETMGAKYLWFNPARFPAEAALSASYDRNGIVRRVLHLDGREIDFREVTAVWYRRPQIPQPAPEVREEELRRWVSEVSSYFLLGIWDTLDCRWVPARPRDLFPAEDKTHQLALAARLGFHIPRTLITNRPEDFLNFYAECRGHIVTKVLREGYVRRGGEGYSAYTHAVRRRDAARYQAIRYAPVILQEYVPKRLELRVTVVGSRVFAVEIHSQAGRMTQHDWRHYDLERTPHALHTLPAEMESLCLRLLHALRLCFGAIDMILTPEGEYVFLEINPNGQWGWIEDLTGLPISYAVAELLVHGDVALAKGERDASSL